ncbi:sirohydrochlorin chelatase [Nocardioidaceae bacterium]|nr:sirohydrochlorin chelatase [Nocardioidaceae bacterium]
MSAPALVLLGYGSRDARATGVVDAYAARLRARRPDLPVSAAYLAHSSPTLDVVVAGLAAAGHDEVVVVPLLLTGGRHASRDVPAAVDAARSAAPGIRVTTAPRLGLRPTWLSVLDERVRDSLRVARVAELDALVLACAGSADHRVTAAVARLGRLWSQQHRLPVLTAYAAVAPPSPGEAVRQLRAEGRRAVAVGSFFLAPGVMSDRSAELSLEAGAVAVSAPLGVHEALVEQLLHRYQVAALGALTLA